MFHQLPGYPGIHSNFLWKIHNIFRLLRFLSIKFENNLKMRVRLIFNAKNILFTSNFFKLYNSQSVWIYINTDFSHSLHNFLCFLCAFLKIQQAHLTLIAFISHVSTCLKFFRLLSELAACSNNDKNFFNVLPVLYLDCSFCDWYWIAGNSHIFPGKTDKYCLFHK